MQRQDRLLLFAFDGNRLDPRLLLRYPDRPCIPCVSFLLPLTNGLVGAEVVIARSRSDRTGDRPHGKGVVTDDVRYPAAGESPIPETLSAALACRSQTSTLGVPRQPALEAVGRLLHRCTWRSRGRHACKGPPASDLQASLHLRLHRPPHKSAVSRRHAWTHAASSGSGTRSGANREATPLKSGLERHGRACLVTRRRCRSQGGAPGEGVLPGRGSGVGRHPSRQADRESNLRTVSGRSPSEEYESRNCVWSRPVTHVGAVNLLAGHVCRGGGAILGLSSSHDRRETRRCDPEP